MNGNLTLTDGRIDKYLFPGGYCHATGPGFFCIAKPAPPFFWEDDGSISPIPGYDYQAMLERWREAVAAEEAKDGFAFYYYNQDHLGNIREVVDEKGNVCQVTNYYPFGTPYCDSISVSGSTLQPYKYNGKELDLMHGLNTYDYGARQLNPVLCAWDRMDQLCEDNYSVSPYVYCRNNPVNRIDPDGNDDYYTIFGQYLYSDNKDTDYIIIRNQPFYELKQKTDMKWIKTDTPLENANLAAEAYSNIFTDVLSKMEGVDVNDLHNGKVSVTVWDEDLSNIKTSKNYCNDPDFDGSSLATRHKANNEHVITAYIYNIGTKEKRMYSTVSNVQNLLGVHEYMAHLKKGLKDSQHDIIFRMQKHWIFKI